MHTPRPMQMCYAHCTCAQTCMDASKFYVIIVMTQPKVVTLDSFAPLFAQPGLVKSCASAETATAATFAGMEFVLLLFGGNVRYL